MTGAAGVGPEPSPVGSRPWLHVVAQATRLATLQYFDNINTCVATTRIGLAVLERYGVRAVPLSVLVTVYNPKAYRLVQDRVPISQWPDDAWNLAIGARARATDVPHDGSGWSGHLVVLVRQPGEPRLLIDMTADQFDRPYRDLHVSGPVFMGIAPGSAFTPQDPLSAVVDREGANPTIVEYRPAPPGDPESKRWRDVGDWVKVGADIERGGPIRDVLDAICAEVDRYTA